MHKQINIIIMSIIFAILLIEVLEAQIKISHDVFSNGIGNLTGSSQNIHSTIGQTLTGIYKNQKYTSEVGFWYAAYQVVTQATEQQDLLPVIFEMFQNYPNPFNPTTTIKYSIPASLNPSQGVTLTQLKIFDILGREVATLVNEAKAPGNYEVNFDAINLASGVYFYRLQAGSFVQTKKMMLMK